MEGKAPADTGGRLGITLSTVNTHLQRVFDKTGTSDQADLIRLVGPTGRRDPKVRSIGDRGLGRIE